MGHERKDFFGGRSMGVGACYRTAHGRFAWPTKAAGLQDMVCPTCGRALHQTVARETARGGFTELSEAVARKLAKPQKDRRTFVRVAGAKALAAWDEANPEPTPRSEPFTHNGHEYERMTEAWRAWNTARRVARYDLHRAAAATWEARHPHVKRSAR